MNTNMYSEVNVIPHESNVISKEGFSLLFGDDDDLDRKNKTISLNIDTEYNNDTNHNKSRFSNESIIILATGVGVGIVMFIPNGLMGDSGTPDALKMSHLGMFSSLLLIIGGIVGCFLNRWIALLPGLFVQFSPFILYNLFGANATIIVNVIFLVTYLCSVCYVYQRKQ